MCLVSHVFGLSAAEEELHTGGSLEFIKAVTHQDRGHVAGRALVFEAGPHLLD